jgi:hypothetical protein
MGDVAALICVASAASHCQQAAAAQLWRLLTMLAPCVRRPALQRSEAATEERSQRARSIQPSAVAVRSSMSASALHAVQGSGTPAAQALQTSPFAPPPVQASPFAAAPTAPSPFAELPPTETEGEGEGPARAGGAALVSPFSSGALPAGLHFDVQQHAAAVAAAAAAGAPSGQPRNRSKPADGK